MLGNLVRRGAASSGSSMLANGGRLLSTPSTPPPVSIFVKVKIEESRTEDFLKAMAVDVAGSRLEDGCHRFDLLQDHQDPQTFYFYEVYKDAAAIATHKEMPHYKAWADFKAEGGVLSQTVIKADAIDFTF